MKNKIKIQHLQLIRMADFDTRAYKKFIKSISDILRSFLKN
jgi:hypothetical protein